MPMMVDGCTVEDGWCQKQHTSLDKSRMRSDDDNSHSRVIKTTEHSRPFETGMQIEKLCQIVFDSRGMKT